MNSSDFQLQASSDARLAVHAAAHRPSWLWSIDGTRVMWANPAGARLFGAGDSAELARRTFGPTDRRHRQVAQLVHRLPLNGAVRLERLRGFGAPFGMPMTCACARLELPDGSHGILITAMEAIRNTLLVKRLPAGVVEANAEAETQPPPMESEAPASNVEPPMGANSQSADLGGAIETAANVVPFRPTGETRAPTLTPGEISAFNELARELSERLERETNTDNVVALASGTGTADVETTKAAEPPPRGNHACSRSLINLLPAEILICRPDCLLHANPAFLARMGYPSLRALEDAGGLDALNIEPGISSTTSASSPTSALEAGEPVTISATNPAKDRACSIEARLHIIDWDGGCALALICAPPQTVPVIAEPVTASVEQTESEQPIEAGQSNAEDLAANPDTTAEGMFRECSQSTESKTELNQTERLADSAANAKADMLARVSQAIRTPLDAIIGIAEATMSERPGELGREHYSEYMKDIRASGERVVSILDEALELSRIETGNDLSFTNLDLNHLIEACVSVMQPQANCERIIIRTSLAHALPPVHADARAMRQIARNLISHSIRLAGAGGLVVVSTALTEGGDVALQIHDDGHGLGAKDAATRTDTSESLSLTKALVEANRARFNIRSAANSGTLIDVVFSPGRG